MCLLIMEKQEGKFMVDSKGKSYWSPDGSERKVIDSKKAESLKQQVDLEI